MSISYSETLFDNHLQSLIFLLNFACRVGEIIGLTRSSFLNEVFVAHIVDFLEKLTYFEVNVYLQSAISIISKLISETVFLLFDLGAKALSKAIYI